MLRLFQAFKRDRQQVTCHERKRDSLSLVVVYAACAGMSPGKPLFFATDEDRDGTDPFTDTYDQSLYPIEYFEDTLSLIGTLIPTARNRTTAVSEQPAHSGLALVFALDCLCPFQPCRQLEFCDCTTLYESGS